jgi:hypothetical protein
LRCPLWVSSLLIGRNAVRPVILIICTVAVLIGLPRLAVYFREPKHFGLILDAPGKRTADVRRTAAPPANGLAPASNAVKEPVVQANSATPSLPASEADLIVAIQRELARIGYYGGPITTGWTEGVRDAVRKFSGLGRTKPSQQLLIALRAAKPEFQGNVARQGATLNLQAAQDLINGRIPATLVDTPEEGLLSEGYLPPWAALRARYTQIAQSLPPGDNGALTVRISARSSRIDTRRRARRSYAISRRRSRFVYNYGGFFGF